MEAGVAPRRETPLPADQELRSKVRTRRTSGTRAKYLLCLLVSGSHSSLKLNDPLMASLLKHSYARGIRISVTTKSTPKKTNFVRKFSSTVSESSKDAITWPEYLEIRRGKRRWETVGCALSGNAPIDPLSSGRDHPCFPSWPRGWSRVLWLTRDGRDQTNHGEPPTARHVLK